MTLRASILWSTGAALLIGALYLAANSFSSASSATMSQNSETWPPRWGLPSTAEDEHILIRDGFSISDCTPLNQLLAEKELSLETHFPVVAARIAHSGACGTTDKAYAYATAHSAVEAGNYTYDALYLLGEAALSQDKSVVDTAESDKWFHEAVLVAGPTYFYHRDVEKNRPSEQLFKKHPWGLNQSDTYLKLGNDIIAPIETVPEFQQHIKWLDELYEKRDADQIISIAKSIRQGDFGGKYGILSAFEWLDYADYFLGSNKAKSLKLDWIRDKALQQSCWEAKNLDCHARTVAPKNMHLVYQASSVGDQDAEPIMHCMLNLLKSPQGREQAEASWQAAKLVDQEIRDHEQKLGAPIRYGTLDLRWARAFRFEHQLPKSIRIADMDLSMAIESKLFDRDSHYLDMHDIFTKYGVTGYQCF